ncbi:MAG: F0F1 ATP synthase subunit A [Candidatus Eisenbacteria bacterium]|uniref:ATP synthase subunit a n=1 Tax=Eiseniibacteriota bacterium TaxID=2212470 RepID=A0A849SFH4_UNCEI|nr:F0F1 ATP synthase subunit A [Candidatus Eisenbacteria bacterium]
MGLEFLSRVRRSSLLAAVVVALATAVYVDLRHGIGVAAGTAWCLVNLSLLAHLVRGVSERSSATALRRVVLSMVGTLAWFGAGAWLLVQLPPMALAAGFTLPFVVMVLKAASTMLIESPAWAPMTRGRWVGAVVLAVALGAIALVSRFGPDAPRANAQEHGAHSATTAPPAAHGAPAPGEHAPAPGEHVPAAGPKKFDTVLSVLAKSNHGNAVGRFIHTFEPVLFSGAVAILLCIVMLLAARNYQRIPGPLANVVEMLVEALQNFVVGILGPEHGKRFTPFLGSLFLYIWWMNWFGLVPFMEAPTSNLNVTLALALVVVIYVQYVAVRALGFGGYLHHLAGSPRSAIEWGLVPLMLPIHVIGELAKPVSLSCRLFGNIFGEDMLLVGFTTLGVGVLAATGLPFGLPIQLPFLFLSLMMGTIQALVFTMLSTVYLLLMLPHDDHGHGHEAEAHHAH